MKRNSRRVHILIDLLILMILCLILSLLLDEGAVRNICADIGLLCGMATVVLAILFTIDNHDIKFIDVPEEKEDKEE